MHMYDDFFIIIINIGGINFAMSSDILEWKTVMLFCR